MTGQEVIDEAVKPWCGLHLGLIIAAHAVTNGHSDPARLARLAIDMLHQVGYISGPDTAARTRFTGMGITKWQTALYAVNELPDWRFPDDVLLVGWLIECGGPSIGRGPTTARYEQGGSEHYVGGTRTRYNTGTYGHGGPGWPTSRRYFPGDCLHLRVRPDSSGSGI